MIEKETLFVLGAGASCPYGLPTGTELNRILCGVNGFTHEIAQTLWKFADIDPGETAEFSRAFLMSRMPSVDAFLATRTQFAKVGKHAIAAVLTAREHPGLIHNPNPIGAWDDWYSVLWAQMREGASRATDIKDNQVRFVTFNYDRSLEYFLHHAIKESFAVDDATAEGVWSSMGILHLYGSLGRFSMTHADDVRGYSSDPSMRDLEVAARSLRVMSEARTDDTFALARNWFQWAQRVCFLGFGFDSLNVQRLGFKNCMIPATHKYIVASVYGKRRGEIAKLQHEILGTQLGDWKQQVILGTGSTVYQWEHHDRVCSETLKESLIFMPR